MTTYGLTANGYVVKQQQVIISEIQAVLQAALGVNINLLPQAVFGQIVNVFSEREALLWQLGEAIYASQYPAGAEGTSVDNILSYNNLKRLQATATVTAPTSTGGTPGLVLYGTPGTVIPAGSSIVVENNPTLQFTLDAAVTIQPSVNAVQLLALYGGQPNAGSFALQIVDPAGNTLTSPLIAWNALANQTSITWPVAPTSGQFVLAVGNLLTPPILYTDVASTIQGYITALSATYAGVTVTGSFASGLVINWGTASQSLVQANSIQLAYSATPTAGSLQISIGGTPVPLVAYNATAAALQAAINTLPGYGKVTVSGAPTSPNGYYINWQSATPGAVLVTTQPTGATVTPTATNTLNPTTTVVNSIQSAINTLYDAIASNYPYTDVGVTGSLSSTLVTLTFGGATVVVGQPASGAQPQKTFVAISDTLQNGTVVVNINITTTAIGAPPEGIGSATCTVTGPNVVSAGFLNVIGSPVSGWASVNNPLDCITGTNAETDTQALQRRTTELSAQANGPLQSIQEKVNLVPGVVQALGFQNLSNAADQIVTFSAVPTAGYFSIAFTGPGGTLQTTAHIPWNALSTVQQVVFTGTPTAGFFTLTFGAQTTANIPYNANALTVQTAVRALTGFSAATVTGSIASSFFIALSYGPQQPVSVTSSLTGSVASGIPSVQSLINALPSYNLAVITGSFSVGFTISFNGSSGGQPQLLVLITNALTGVFTVTVAYGRPGNSFEIVVNDNNGEASNLAIAQAIYGAKPAGIESYGTVTVPITNSFGNTYPISFSRPVQVPIYVVISLQTDLTTSLNPKFNPQSVTAIQQDVVAIGQAFPVGGLIVGFGTGGLIGAFNTIPGILNYSLAFGTSPNPTQNSNIQLQAEQVGQFESFLVLVSYT